MKRAILGLAVCVAVAGLAPAAHGLSMDITYNVSATASLGGTAMGTITGTVGIRYTATGTPGQVTTSLGTVLHGPAHLLGGTLTGTFSAMVYGDTVTGSLTAIMPGSPPGTLKSVGSLSFPAVNVIVNGLIHCTGATCGLVGLPQSLPVPLSSLFPPVVVPVKVPGAAPGSALPKTLTWSAMSLGSMGSMPLTATVVATEINRHLVPEPSTLPLVAMGLAGIAGVAARQRSRRR